jgi:hypothetical protein
MYPETSTLPKQQCLVPSGRSIVDNLSAEYLMSKMLATKLSPTELISNMVRRELSLGEIVQAG